MISRIQNGQNDPKDQNGDNGDGEEKEWARARAAA